MDPNAFHGGHAPSSCLVVPEEGSLVAHFFSGALRPSAPACMPFDRLGCEPQTVIVTTCKELLDVVCCQCRRKLRVLRSMCLMYE